MTAILGKKTDVWSMKLISLLAVAGVGLITSYAFAADEPLSGTDENAFLDPFALTIYQPQKTSSRNSTDDASNESLPGTILYEMSTTTASTTTATSTSRSPIPIATLRHWVMIPYRPPIRSPFLPW